MTNWDDVDWEFRAFLWIVGALIVAAVAFLIYLTVTVFLQTM